MSLTLYYHPLSSYCHKVLIALYENNVTFEKCLIDLGNDEERKALQSVWPIGKFPVIRDHACNRDIPEATIIIEYLDHFFAGKNPLIPTDRDSALEVRLWDRIFDNYFQSPMQHIVGDRIRGANSDLTREKATLDTAYKLLDTHMASKKAWMASDDFSMADCAAAPALFYAGMVHPFPDQFTNLKAYFDRLVERPSVKHVLEEAKPYFKFFHLQKQFRSGFYNTLHKKTASWRFFYLRVADGALFLLNSHCNTLFLQQQTRNRFFIYPHKYPRYLKAWKPFV